jgi:hypothetical protein
MKSLFLATLAALPALAQSSPADPAASPPVVGGTEVVGYTTQSAETGYWGQPGWVQRRPFSTTRVHIQRSPGEIAVEQWMRWRNNDGNNKLRMSQEVEIGLPGRMQADFYWDWTYEGSKAEHLDLAAELRWAPADWGEIFGNPTLYLEYKWVNDERGGDVLEPKILFGDDFGDGWHWGLNLIYERELKGEKAEERAVTAAISKTISESLSVGMEAAYKRETVDGARDNPEHKVLVGPNIQWRITKNLYINLAALAGVTDDAPDFEGWFILGYNFNGPTAGSPISSRRR